MTAQLEIIETFLANESDATKFTTAELRAIAAHYGFKSARIATRRALTRFLASLDD